MLHQSWLLAILASLALCAPVARESGPPTLTLVHGISDAKFTDGLPEIEVDRANKQGRPLEGKKTVIGSKTTSNDTSEESKYEPDGKMGLNRANIKSWALKGGPAGIKNVTVDRGSKSLDGHPAHSTGTSYSGVSSGTSGGTIGGTFSHGSGGDTGDASNTGSRGTTTGSDGTTRASNFGRGLPID